MPETVLDARTTARLPELLTRYDRPVPRYTSYPTADRFVDAFTVEDYAKALGRAAEHPELPLSVYVHLPFCSKLCTYCGCTVVVSNNDAKKTSYLDRVLVEIDRVSALLEHRRHVMEIHLGGGTPNSYAPGELARLLAHIEERFDVDPAAEISIEVDPRRSTREQIFELREVGFKRLSMGVQDFDPHVQEAVGRVQSLDETTAVMHAARDAGFSSVNMDLIYGLPMQTRASFSRTVAKTLELRPDRIALFSFAYVPDVRPHQKKIPLAALPESAAKLDLFLLARAAFLDAGYVEIGMDHFALPDDPLARAAREGTLHRNFQGYTVLKGADLVGFGMSAIGEVGGAYAANPRRLDEYERAIDAGGLACVRGFALSPEDEIARFAIREVMCGLTLSSHALHTRFGVGLDEAFPGYAARLAPLVDEGFVELAGAGPDAAVRVTPLGRLFVRHAAAAFDRYLIGDRATGHYSRAV